MSGTAGARTAQPRSPFELRKHNGLIFDALGGESMEKSRGNDPFADFHFILDIEGMTGGFSEVEGLPNDCEARELMGERRFTRISLKRGLTNTKDLWDWYKAAKDRKTRRLSGTITVLDEVRTAALVWKFDEAVPQKWEGPGLNATASEVAIEELEICVEGLTLTSPSEDPEAKKTSQTGTRRD